MKKVIVGILAVITVSSAPLAGADTATKHCKITPPLAVVKPATTAPRNGGEGGEDWPVTPRSTTLDCQ